MKLKATTTNGFNHLGGGGGTLDLPLLYTALDNGHLFITATFFCRQGGCCGVVHDQLH